MIIIAVEKKEFPGWLDFQSWKEEEEAQTYSCFVQANGEVTGSEEKTGGSSFVQIVIVSFINANNRLNSQHFVCVLQRWLQTAYINQLS